MGDPHADLTAQQLRQQQVACLCEFSRFYLARGNEVIEWAGQILECFLRLLRR